MSKKCKKFDPLNYEAPEVLGSGSFGTVYKVYDKEAKKTLVYKEISKIPKASTITSQVLESKILREIDILVQLQYLCPKSVLCYHDCAESDENFYIVTEYLGEYVVPIGIDLSIYTSAALKTLVANMIKGLSDIHDTGIAHRDIKTDNIMINPLTLDVKYIDFGLSCSQEQCNEAGSPGSPHYMAPEVIQDKLHHGSSRYQPHDLEGWKKADYWSLGMTILEIALGDPFFDYINKIDTGKILGEIDELSMLMSNMMFSDNWLNDWLDRILSDPEPTVNVRFLKKTKPIILRLVKYYPNKRVLEL